jgi:hypothetical protein
MLMQPGHGVDHTSLSSADVKNEYSCFPSVPVMARYGETFTLLKQVEVHAKQNHSGQGIKLLTVT